MATSNRAKSKVDLKKPAKTTEERLQRLKQTAELLAKRPSLQIAENFCLNSRYALMGIVKDWDESKANRKPQLQEFVVAMTAGRESLLQVRANPEKESEADYLGLILRNCDRRWYWGQLLLNTDDLSMVLSEMLVFVKQEVVDLAPYVSIAV